MKRRTLRIIGAGAMVAGAISVGLPAGASEGSWHADAVVAVVGDSGVDILHPDFRTPDGRDVSLPPAVSHVAVRVDLPRSGSRVDQLQFLRAGPLGHARANTVYYVRGTRLVLYTGSPVHDLLAGDFHGTGTASLAGGRRVGTAPKALIVMTTGYADEAWAWVSRQSWIDVATSSAFEILGPGFPCAGANGVHSFRATGHLAFIAAGNGAFESSATPPGGLPDVIRVGGVHPDGTSVTPYVGDPSAHDPTSYSARLYDVGELYTNLIADSSQPSGYGRASGTSGSSPRLAGRVAALLATIRQAVGDSGIGVRDGALVTARSELRPAAGPLADGRLTADELQLAVLESARPASSTEPGRYFAEGYGYFDRAAAAVAADVILGKRQMAARMLDDTAFSAELAGRGAAASARGCAN